MRFYHCLVSLFFSLLIAIFMLPSMAQQEIGSSYNPCYNPCYHQNYRSDGPLTHVRSENFNYNYEGGYNHCTPPPCHVPPPCHTPQVPQAPAPAFVPPPVAPTPPPTPTPPPVVQAPPTPPVIPVIPHNVPFIQTQQIDQTNVIPQTPRPPSPILIGNVSDGVQLISDNRFPTVKDFKGGGEWILVRGENDSHFTRPNEYTAKLESGTILVSVRRPSNLALVQTPLGDIALRSDGDTLLSFVDGVIRIYNISALGSDLKVKLSPEVTHSGHSQSFVLKTGYELIASTHVLTRPDLRPPDGIARRRSQIVAKGHIGITEFSVQSVLSSSTIIAQIANAPEANAKETRVLGQMSKMAAVLNVINNPGTYSIEGTTGIASNPNNQTH